MELRNVVQAGKNEGAPKALNSRRTQGTPAEIGFDFVDELNFFRDELHFSLNMNSVEHAEARRPRGAQRFVATSTHRQQSNGPVRVATRGLT